jgi:hypothetical protein
MFPIMSSFGDKTDAQIEYGTLRDGSLPSICSSSDSVDKNWSPPPNQKEDLYSWMAKQSEKGDKEKEHSTDDKTANDIERPASPRPAIHSYMQDSQRLLDAHLIFEPMLTCLGVMPSQMINNVSNPDISSLDSLGTNLSLVGSFDAMKIDIVVSETNENGKKTAKSKLGKKPTGNGKFGLTISPPETPAFLCERVGVELEVIKMTDGLREDAKQNILYLSRGQLKKHTSTVINFSLNVRYISQQVNMPLLRLLHQITNMYQNVKEAQNELREQQPDVIATGKRHPGPAKDESSLSEMIDHHTLMGSIHDPIVSDVTLMDNDETYDKFNEAIPLGHSVSRTRMPSLGPLIPLTPSPNARNRPQSFAQKLRSTSKTVKGKLGYTNLAETISTPNKTSPTVSTFEQSITRSIMEPKNSLTGGLSVTLGGIYAKVAFVTSVLWFCVCV